MYYVLSLNTDALTGSLYLNTFLAGAVEFPANVLAVFLLQWRFTGRRLTCALSLIIAGVASLVSIYMILEGNPTTLHKCLYCYTENKPDQM